MNDKEFQAWLRQIATLDAPQFESALAELRRIAENVDGDPVDPAWAQAGLCLRAAEHAVANRKGN
jgi:hypothetical protein